MQHHASNRSGRDFVIGDLHGCMDALRYLLCEVRFDTTRDRLFSVGDLIDRGDQSEAALGLLDRPWFFSVTGNHEDMLCAVAEGRQPRSSWNAIGGSWAETLPEAALLHYAQRLRELPLVRVVGVGAARFNVLHAEFFGADDDLDAGRFDDVVRERLLWGRELALGAVDPSFFTRALSLTYCGHTPVHEVTRIGSQMFIDTGAFIAEGRLTMVETFSPRLWSISTREAREHGAEAFKLP